MNVALGLEKAAKPRSKQNAKSLQKTWAVRFKHQEVKKCAHSLQILAFCLTFVNGAGYARVSGVNELRVGVVPCLVMNDDVNGGSPGTLHVVMRLAGDSPSRHLRRKKRM